MRRLLRIAVVLVLANVVLTVVVAQTRVYVFNGVAYRWPTSQGSASEALSTTDALGTLDWLSVAGASDWPSDMLVFSPTGTCPTGWSEYTAGRGRYIVGLVSGGTNAATVGTVLTDQETRAVGQHTHGVTDPGHTHVQDPHSHAVTDPGHVHTGSLGSTSVGITVGNDAMGVASGSTTTTSSTTGVTIGSETATTSSSTTGASLANAGSVSGTNAPYVQLKLCRTP